MQVLETHHAYLTAYEVLQVVKKRRDAAHPYNDSRDAKYLGEYRRIARARDLLIPSLLAHSPPGTVENGEDDVGQRIAEFTQEIMHLVPEISPQQIRDIIAYQPKNELQLNAIFMKANEWEIIQYHVHPIFELIDKYFPPEEIDPEPEPEAEKQPEPEPEPAK